MAEHWRVSCDASAAYAPPVTATPPSERHTLWGGELQAGVITFRSLFVARGARQQKQYQRAEAAQLKKPRVNVSSIALDALVAGDVQLWHIDVEGAELPVLRSAARLLQQRRVQRIVLEVIPSAWAKFGVPDLGREGLPSLRTPFATIAAASRVTARRTTGTCGLPPRAPRMPRSA